MSALLATGLVLAIEAGPMVRWSIDCEWRDGNRSNHLVLDGAGPLQRTLGAGFADCTVTLRAGEQLTATLADRHGSRARSTIAGEGSRARLRQR